MKYPDILNELNEVVDHSSVEQDFTVRSGFVFEAVTNPANVYDALVIRNPSNAHAWGERRAISDRSLEEHISLVNQLQLEKAVVIGEDLRFLSRCPSLKHLIVIPSENADTFDFSPLYALPEIQSILCVTNYGKFDTKSADMDYSRLHGLQALTVRSKNDLNYQHIQGLRYLDVSNDPSPDLNGIFCSKDLDTLSVTSCRIRSLSGIDQSSKMQCLYLYHDRLLENIEDLERVSHTLRALHIESCSRIQDLSVLSKLENLEYLFLKGSNKLESLAFIKDLPKLKTLVFDMEILDGDLTPCLSLSYVHCGKMKKQYNVKAKDLPKNTYYQGNDNIEIWRRFM